MTQQVAPTEALEWRDSAGPLLAAAGVAALTVALRLRDPHQLGSWGLCPFKAFTGWDCPGCGGLRAVNDLTHGNISAAASSNLFLVASIPLLVALWGLWFWRSSHTGAAQRRLLPRGRAKLLVGLYLGLLVAFTIFRNTPWGNAFYA
ncbi:MAG: DUF2752 domain-containing protein [Actinomycetota bacterium]|nr:DUF2752 domain-containing protein [Actinomycetota bacterium]